MPGSHQAYALLETIGTLAEEIARACPPCAEKAAQIVSLIGEIQSVAVDRASVQDALESETVDSDLSDAKVRNAADAVVRATRDEHDV